MDIESARLAKAAAEATDADQRSGGRRRRWVDVLIIGPIVVNTIYYYAGLPLNAFLIGTHPVLLEFIRGSTVSMLAAGGFARVGKAALPAALLAPVLISIWTDPCYFYAGRRYGRRIIEYYERNDPRWRKRIARGERFFRKFGLWTVVFAPFLPVPSALFYLAAGEAGMPFLLFILADTAGTLLYIAMFVAIGCFVGQHAVDVAQTITHYAWWILGGTILLAVVYSIWASWSSNRQPVE
ncbi:MAG: DedA family protein [Candidatus Dormibacteraeota bacterium]|nr:DedA family protein [Candidatus Dormibacteraeota bacterium]